MIENWLGKFVVRVMNVFYFLLGGLIDIWDNFNCMCLVDFERFLMFKMLCMYFIFD